MISGNGNTGLHLRQAQNVQNVAGQNWITTLPFFLRIESPIVS